MKIRTIDGQIGHWFARALFMYRIESVPKPIYKKALFAGRERLRAGDVRGARDVVYRQVSKRWQYLNSERIEEFIEEWME